MSSQATTANPLFTGSPRRNAMLLGAKLAIAAGIIFYLIHTQRLGIGRLRAAFEFPSQSLAALALLLLLPIVISQRWHILLRSLEYEFDFRDVLGLTFMAIFLDTVMPGGTADIVRGYYLDRHFRPQDRLRAASTVVVDRFLGLMALVLLALGALAARARVVLGDSALRPIAEVVAALGVLFILIFVFLAVEGDPGRRILAAIASRIRIGGLALRIYDAFRGYRKNVGTLLLALGLSGLSHVLTIGSLALLGKALGESHLSLADYIYLTPLGLFAAQIPISPGGIGVGHAAFYTLFAMAGSRLGADLFSLFIVIRFISALPGLFYFLAWSRQARKTVPDAADGSL